MAIRVIEYQWLFVCVRLFVAVDGNYACCAHTQYRKLYPQLRIRATIMGLNVGP
jgi:hypothetical protein